MRQVEAPILNVRKLGARYVLHTYSAPSLAKEAQPGQFVHIRVTDGVHPMLRRPFSICSAGEGSIDVLIKVVGEGTKILSSKKSGDILDIIGPLGSSFRMEEQPALLIAGGIGVAPLYFLAQKLKMTGRDILFLYGARTKEDLVLKNEIYSLADKSIFVTEDGSTENRGIVTSRLDAGVVKGRAIYACGPEAMLVSLQKKLRALGKTAQFSLENRMACGVGACQGCVVETVNGYRRVCVDGPIFTSGDIISLPLTGASDE